MAQTIDDNKRRNVPLQVPLFLLQCHAPSDYPLRSGPSWLVLTRQSADVAANAPQAVATDDLLESLPHLLTPEGVDEGVDHRVAHDEDEIHVEVRHEAHAVEVPGARNHQDEVEEEGSPADDEDPQQDGQRDGSLHAGSLVDGVVAGEGGDALHVRARQHEHVAVEGGHDEQHGKEHGDQADDDRGGVWVDDEDDPAASAEGPNPSDDATSPSHGHDVVVPQCIEDGDVPKRHATGQWPQPTREENSNGKFCRLSIFSAIYLLICRLFESITLCLHPFYE